MFKKNTTGSYTRETKHLLKIHYVLETFHTQSPLFSIPSYEMITIIFPYR